MSDRGKTSLWRVSLLCRCPRCGQGPLYQGLLTIRDRCPACGLDLTGNDAADGAVVAVTLVLGTLLVVLAFIVEFEFSPPLWLHALIWPAVGLPLAVIMIRPAKAFLVTQQYRNRPDQMGQP